MIISRLAAAATLAALVTSAAGTFAQEKKAPPTAGVIIPENSGSTGGKKGGQQPFEIGAIIITARPTRPSAVVELGKILPEIEIAKIRQPFLQKIEEAISGEPF